MIIYGDSISGNCLKIKYTADYLGLDYEWQELNLLEGATRTPEFLAMNPAGQVPIVKLDDGKVLAQSNAIIEFLAEGSSLLPADAYQRALVHQWLYWEQYSHEPYIAVLRFHMKYQGKSADQREAWRVERGESALDLMEKSLQHKAFFVGDTITIADIGLLAYTRVAHEGGFDISQREALVQWVTRTEEALGIKGA